MELPSHFFGWVAFLWEEYAPLFLQGTLSTLLLAIAGTGIGFLLGLLIAMVRTVPCAKTDRLPKRVAVWVGNALSTVYIEVFRGTPLIVQAMVIYYGAMQLLQIDIPAMGAAVFILSLNTGAYMSEILRGGVLAIDKGQTEAAQAIGMTHPQTMRKVILPQAIRNALPSICNEFIVNIKDSSVLNVISVSELFFQAKSASGTYLRYFETFFIVAVIYLVLTLLASWLVGLLEKRLDGPGTFEKGPRVHGGRRRGKR